MKTAILQIKKLTQEAMIPIRGTPFAAGYDIFASQEGIVPAKGKALIKTGLSIAVPTGNYARIAPRSGLAWKHFIDTGAGVIDEDYRGEVGILLFNHSDVDFKVERGDRIAQMIIEKITVTEIEEVKNLDNSERGDGGFGSTGVSLNSNKMIPEQIKKESKFVLSDEEKNKQISYEKLLDQVQQLVSSKAIDEDMRIYVCSQLRAGVEQDIIKIIEKYNQANNNQQQEQQLQK